MSRAWTNVRFAIIHRGVGREWEKSGLSFSYVSIIRFWKLLLGFRRAIHMQNFRVDEEIVY